MPELHTFNPDTGLLELAAEIVPLAAKAGHDATSYRARLWSHGEQVRDWRKLSFRKGGMDPNQEAVPFLLQHMDGRGGLFTAPTEPQVLGVAHTFTEESDGVWARFEFVDVPENPLAAKYKALVDAGALRKVSGGIQVHKYERDEDTDAIEVLEWEAAELSLVVIPAMRSADIARNQTESQLVTLADQREATMPEETTTNETTALEDLTAQVEAMEDQIRTLTAERELPTVTGTARGHNFRSMGEIVADTVAMDQKGDRDAQERLGALLEQGLIVATPKGGRLISLAWADELGEISDAASSGAYTDELLRVLRDPMVIGSFFESGNLDEVPGESVTSQKVTAGNVVDYQNAGGEVPSNKQAWGTDSFAKTTLAGGQPLTMQAAQWSQPGYMNEILQDLVGAYGEKVNYELVNGDGLAGPPPHMEGIMTAQASPLSAIGATEAAQAKAFVAKVGAAKAAVWAASKRWARGIFLNGDTFGVIDGWTDADGRPLLGEVSDAMMIGTEGGPTPSGTIRSLRVYIDDAVPDDTAIISSFRNAKHWKSQAAPAQVSLTYPSHLTIDVAVFGFNASAIRRPDAFQVIDGIGQTS